ncbi:MAG: hypothetical protein JHC33_12170 [Ignisphaera sp.]|nr:hypothetical protein [Ignisphaera sp.]
MINRLFTGGGDPILSNLTLNSTAPAITTILGAGYTYTSASLTPTISSDGLKISFAVNRTSDAYNAQYVGTLTTPFDLSTLTSATVLLPFTNNLAPYMFNHDGTKSFYCYASVARVYTHPTPYSLSGTTYVSFTLSITDAYNRSSWNRLGLEYYFRDSTGGGWRKITTTVPYTFTSSVESLLTANNYSCVGTLTNSLIPLYYGDLSAINGNGSIAIGASVIFSFSSDDAYLMTYDTTSNLLKLYR